MNITEWILSIVQQLGYIGIALLMFLDNVFPPIPSEIIMPSAGYAASKGQLLLVGVIMAGSIGSLLAAAVLYWLGFACKNEAIFGFVDRYGKYLFIKRQDIEKSLAWFEQYGHRIVFAGRMIPAVRSLISIPAGMSGMPFWKFMLYSSMGTLIWTSFLACMGYFLGENQALMQRIFSQISYVIVGIVVIFICWLMYRRQQRKKQNAKD